MRSVGQREPNVIPGFGITLGFTTFFLSAIVLLPLSALVLKAAGMDWSRFIDVIGSPRALASYRLSFGASMVAASVNMVFGFALAWTLVRYEFPGRKLVDAIIDMPFALPTAVSGIALTTIFASNGWIGQYLEPYGIQVAYTPLGITIALTLIGMPFVVRTVQPALQEVHVLVRGISQNHASSSRTMMISPKPSPCGIFTPSKRANSASFRNFEFPTRIFS
jgi:sulfate transport system permease protein